MEERGEENDHRGGDSKGKGLRGSKLDCGSPRVTQGLKAQLQAGWPDAHT